MTRATAPFPYFGGKASLSETLCRLLPLHETYVEVFGGAASLLLSKLPSPIEIYNDLDSALVNFFRVLRDPARSRKLKKLLELTPYAREEYDECRVGWKQCSDEVEAARQWFVVARSSFSARAAASSGWKFTTKPDNNPARSFHNAVDGLPAFTQRLREVQIEHKDFRELIPLYDGPNTLLYCDPPYVPEARTPVRAYAHEMTSEDHQRLLEMLCAAKSMVILSGYRSDRYDAMLDRAGWQRIECRVACHAAGRTRASGLQGKGAVLDQPAFRRTECIWRNPACVAAARQQSLFASVS